MVTISLLIHDALKAIEYTQAILDFIILAHYILHNKEITLLYRVYTIQARKYKISI